MKKHDGGLVKLLEVRTERSRQGDDHGAFNLCTFCVKRARGPGILLCKISLIRGSIELTVP